MHGSITSLYKILLSYFCKPDAIHRTELHNLDPNDESIYLPINQIYLGLAVHGLFQRDDIRSNQNIVTDVRLRCRTFFVILCMQIKKRFNFDNNLLKMASILSPKKLLDAKTRQDMPSMYEFVMEVPRIYHSQLQELDNQWRNIPFHSFTDDMMRDPNCDILTFYRNLSNEKDVHGKKIFKTFAGFALDVLSLATSNADVERLFSKVNLLKNEDPKTVCCCLP